MEREIIRTSDGSTTIHIKDWDECYHSKHGAIQEAKHVFIKNGLALFPNQKVSILEIGFGTGLNAFITYLEAQKLGQTIDYIGAEAYPISAEELQSMNYPHELNALTEKVIFDKMHAVNWGEKFDLSENFSLTKRKQFFEDINDIEKFDLIYFDAFGYRVQPELWSVDVFNRMFKALKKDSILVTYAARGVIKRNMIEAGFTVEKLAGPPGKREMFRARK
ncbi:tRNA (5-methylaminomethyl-2-thiouridine)(34)-methyltransferase MnmD [Flavobacterium aquicola]|uniref:tRNA U34 5-methylaminomethyl-2-thiouridine-forming methyltransferase MnmC n=1 Tax=Flavobacterium aquicola TaxID=1682742 RepID=A0A3E0EW98_9FLAO|nr:tRNA (5-methylaminomethyl-2-thiouridine)(34)-methyltransferase MnmD [Flavobacterium aquicola]REH01730.1 tRNA U34 5-methylaminomethyl-2-thiouridine-forming methyltransferase MnmC [Flavobacterium aquicola]